MFRINFVGCEVLEMITEEEVINYKCSNEGCSNVFGEWIALRGLELHKSIICIDCAAAEGERIQTEKDTILSIIFSEGE
jgi:hypothetical protein